MRMWFAILAASFFAANAIAAPIYGGRQETPLLMRALATGASRGNQQAVVAPRAEVAAQKQAEATAAANSQYFDFGTITIMTKQQYINYLRSAGYSGSKQDCLGRYDQYNLYFRADTTQSGTITGNVAGMDKGRLDSICNFLSYAHWCFAMGFAYAIRDPDDGTRISTGNRCYTYDEFCALRGKIADIYRIDDYLSKIMDEIYAYNTEIKPTNKNTVSTFTRMGPAVGGSYKVYDTDSWVMERLPAEQMTRLLCKQ
ncbi:MAG: hypothetical protein LBL46_00950 [Rickettsiales bacterium]|nr:hypothetical protein [Rickettsiales bacterium]